MPFTTYISPPGTSGRGFGGEAPFLILVAVLYWSGGRCAGRRDLLRWRLGLRGRALAGDAFLPSVLARCRWNRALVSRLKEFWDCAPPIAALALGLAGLIANRSWAACSWLLFRNSHRPPWAALRLHRSAYFLHQRGHPAAEAPTPRAFTPIHLRERGVFPLLPIDCY